MSETPDAEPSPGGAAIAGSLERLTLELHDARLRARALAETLEATWRAHMAARREAERVGLLRPLD